MAERPVREPCQPNERPRLGAILAAAGSGTRAGAAKQWADLGGRAMLWRSAKLLLDSGWVNQLVAVVPSGDEAKAERLLADLSCNGDGVRIVSGGATRSQSVLAGLDALIQMIGCDFVAIHDAARPFASSDLLRQVSLASFKTGAAIPALPCTDTIKRGLNGASVETLDRSQLHLAQTPQVFRVDLLRRAFKNFTPITLATDESALVEQLGERVELVAGEPTNVKVTTAEELKQAQSRYLPSVATGIGYDVHPFAAGRPLILGGVQFEGDGLAGHSDADVCAHVLCDAMLGAAGLGDLGAHFPDTDPNWRGVSSLKLLAEVHSKVMALGWGVGNCDVTISARRPRIAPRAAEMRAQLAGTLQIDSARVNVKATTGEGLGFVGRGEGISAWAVVTLIRAQ